MRFYTGLVALALALFSGNAEAAACSCSRNVALPSGNILRPGALIVGLDYGMNLEGDPALWRGFKVIDRYGDSMAGMYMPPMLVQMGTLTATVGLPQQFSISTSLPYMYKDNLGESEMPGDTDLSSFNDVDLTGRWGHLSHDTRTFYGFGLGVTFPTGTVIENSAVRSGRGVIGGTVSANVGRKLSPHVGVAAQATASIGTGADQTGYIVAPNASLVAGARWSPRENGRVDLAVFGIQRWTGQDRKDALVYKNSGSIATDLAAAFASTFWREDVRSAGVMLRGQMPLFQVVGDPMYAQNFGGAVSFSVTAL